ncbi:MAG TPA: hypothetical protein VMM56_11810 [Planctomycetaceae bacterium]|nr:hypothetical protein [Planctomycetaceae bacterium]
MLKQAVCPVLIFLVTNSVANAQAEPKHHRPPQSAADLKFWLENMIWYHNYSLDEIERATGLPPAKIIEAQRAYDIYPETRPERSSEAKLLVLPYPGGRHPRIGFLEGAIRPQRETKASVFLPWDPESYVVVDVPEAIWSNLGLTYLAHTHVPTVWEKTNVELEPLEWERLADGSFKLERTLPNGIRFGTLVVPRKDHVAMEMWLHNGTDETLTDLRVQNCVMLREAEGFNQQTTDNRLSRNPFMAVRNPAGNRWIITAWEPCHRPWGNGRCPCLHSDPKFPDCKPGETKRLRGWLSFYEGTEIDKELDRIEEVGWLTP